MTKAELGAKRTCPNCGAKYYDLNRKPIVCPRCGTVFEAAPPPRARPQPAAPVVVKAKEEEPEAAANEAELVSFEEADEEALESGKVKTPVAGDDDEDEDEEAIEADDDDETFLEEEDEEDEDVGDIIGDVDDEET